MNLLGKIRRLHLRDGVSISEIARRTGVTRKTIRKWLKAPDGVEPKCRRQARHEADALCRPACSDAGNGCTPPTAGATHSAQALRRASDRGIRWRL
jgi:transposase-like protein